MALLRLDKLLSQTGERTRNESAKLIRAGCVAVNGNPVRDPSLKVDMAANEVLLKGQPVTDEPFQYYMLHKPAGILTAARDRNAPTVMACTAALSNAGLNSKAQPNKDKPKASHA